MRIEWLREDGGYTRITDITDAVSTVRWSGSVSQAARMAEVTVLHAPDDVEMSKLNLNIGAGDFIRLYEGDESIFSGEILTAEKLSQNGTVVYSCADLLIHLLNSVGVYNFANTTAEDITRKVCSDFGIKTGVIAASKVPIGKMIVDGSSIYDIIMQAYTKASKQTGNLYICRMNGDALSIEVKGTEVEDYVLAEEYNITNSTYHETIENMVNVVKIYDDNNKQVGEVRRDAWIAQYGIFQQIYKKESGINEVVAAENMLVGIEKRVSIDGIDGNLKCVAGNAVEVQDSATGLRGIFWIDADSHTWENGTHVMNLDLNFKNLMDSKE